MVQISIIAALTFGSLTVRISFGVHDQYMTCNTRTLAQMAAGPVSRPGSSARGQNRAAALTLQESRQSGSLQNRGGTGAAAPNQIRQCALEESHQPKCLQNRGGRAQSDSSMREAHNRNGRQSFIKAPSSTPSTPQTCQTCSRSTTFPPST